MVGGPGHALRCPQCGFQSVLTPPLGGYGAPPPMMHAPPQRSSSNVVLWVVVGVAALTILVPFCLVGLGVLSSIAMFTAAREGAPPVVGTPEPEAPPPPLHNESWICLLNDVDGDGAAEIGALVSRGRDDMKRPAILDGATGEARFVGEPLGQSRDLRLLCAGPDWLAVLDNEAFELRLHPITSPESPLVHSLTDEVDRYGVDERCIDLRLEDGNRPSFSLGDGTASSCSVGGDPSQPDVSDSTTCGIIRMARRGRTVSAGGVDYQIHVRPRGTELLQVTARRGGRDLWDRPLDLVPVGGTAIGCFAGAALASTVVVLGSQRADGLGGGVVAVGLAEENGAERWRTVLAGDRIGRVDDVFSNGRFVVVSLRRELHAIDPATGQSAWQL